MAIKLSNQTRFTHPAPSVFQVGVAAPNRITHIFQEAVTTGDILDLLIWPAHTELVDAYAIVEGTFTGTADIGLLSGAPGDVGARTLSADLIFDNLDLTALTVQRMSLGAPLKLPAVGHDRSIGLVPSANITAATSKKITLCAVFAAKQS